MGLKTGFTFLTRIVRSKSAVNGASRLLKRSASSAIQCEKQVGDLFVSKSSNSKILSELEALIIQHAPAQKQTALINKFKNFAADKEAATVLESLFDSLKINSKATGANFILKYNKLFNNLNILKENNPEEFKLMIDGGFFKLLKEGKIHPDNLNANMANARISRSLLADLQKAARGEDFVPDLSKLPMEELTKIIKEGDTYLKDGKLFVNWRGTINEVQLSKEKYLELFPPVLRNISNQGNIGNCWLVGQLDNLATSESGRAGLLRLFRQEGEDIFIRFPDCEKEILFPSGKILLTKKNKQMKSIPGLEMVEQAMAVHRGNKYAKGPVTNIEQFSKNPDRLMDNLDSHLTLKNLFNFYKDIFNKFINAVKKPEPLDLISGETVDHVYDIGFNVYTKNTILARLKSIFSKKQNKKIMRDIIDTQANNQNLHLGISFSSSTPKEYSDLYNMVPQHKLTLKAVEGNQCYISNPWYNWIEKGVDEDTLLKYTRDLQVPFVWG